jgi:hypothetical protein
VEPIVVVGHRVVLTALVVGKKVVEAPEVVGQKVVLTMLVVGKNVVEAPDDVGQKVELLMSVVVGHSVHQVVLLPYEVVVR